VDTSYRLGVSIVVGTVLASAALCLALVRPYPAPARAAQDLGGQPFSLGRFRLVGRDGRTVTDADLAGGPWVASFIFTRCPLSCPRISSVMKGLQDKLAGTEVRLVSLTVDPDHDTPEVLAEYARRFGADGDRWWFLTGPKVDLHDLTVGRFKLGVSASGEPDRGGGAEAILHSDRLALVGPGNQVAGYFDSNDPVAVAQLIARARRLDSGRVIRRLPAVNAALNAACATLLVWGWTLIRTGRVRGHAACMVAAVAASALFLTSYLVYHYHVGSVAFRGIGPARYVYFTVLLSHTALATLGVVPLVTLTLARALRREFGRHARIAKVTFPIWLYVSITGLVVYFMLYQMDISGSPGS
jgi:protein SCO1